MQITEHSVTEIMIERNNLTCGYQCAETPSSDVSRDSRSL